MGNLYQLMMKGDHLFFIGTFTYTKFQAALDYTNSVSGICLQISFEHVYVSPTLQTPSLTYAVTKH
jgi:hypothetical protein